MVVTVDSLRYDFQEALEYGERIRFKYYTQALTGSYYDDAVTLTQSGANLFTSGLVRPIDSLKGSYESVLVQQGRLLDNDIILYVDGNVQTSGTFKFGVGSPNYREHSIIENGIIAHTIHGEIVYKKIYGRLLTNGSLTGE